MMMRQAAAALMLALCVVSARANKVNDWSGDTVVQGSATSAECAGDVFPDKLDSNFAGFEIEYKGSYKVLTNTKENKKYVLWQRGCTKPDSETGVDEYFEVPLKAVWSTSSTINSGIEYMGERKALRVVSGLYTNSPCIHEQNQDGYTFDSAGIKWDFDNDQWCTAEWNSDWTAQTCTGVAQWAEDLNIDGIFTWKFGSSSPTDPVVPYEIVMSDTKEDTFLKISEWNKYVAAFFNREKEMMDFDTNMRARWVCSSKASEAIPEAEKKKVLYLNHLWYSTAGDYPGDYKIATCTADKAQYRYCELLKAANVIVANEDVSGLLARTHDPPYEISSATGEVLGIDAADIAAWAADVDVIIFANTWCPVDQEECVAEFNKILDSFKDVKAVKDKNIFDVGRRHDPFGGTAFLAEAHLEPDVLLEDVIKVTYPEVAPHHELVWLRNMQEEGTGNKHTCAEYPDREGCTPTASQLAAMCVQEERHQLLNDGCPLDPDPSSASRLQGSGLVALLAGVTLALAAATA